MYLDWFIHSCTQRVWRNDYLFLGHYGSMVLLALVAYPATPNCSMWFNQRNSAGHCKKGGRGGSRVFRFICTCSFDVFDYCSTSGSKAYSHVTGVLHHVYSQIPVRTSLYACRPVCYIVRSCTQLGCYTSSGSKRQYFSIRLLCCMATLREIMARGTHMWWLRETRLIRDMGCWIIEYGTQISIYSVLVTWGCWTCSIVFTPCHKTHTEPGYIDTPSVQFSPILLKSLAWVVLGSLVHYLVEINWLHRLVEGRSLYRYYALPAGVQYFYLDTNT